MSTQTLNPTNTATTETNTKRYTWSDDPDALTWKQVQHMGLDEQEAALEARGFGDAGSANLEAIIESTNKWIVALAHMGEKHAYQVLAVARSLFIYERSIRDGECED